MDVLEQVLAQALFGSEESPQRQQVCGDVSCVCIWRCFMHVGMAMFRACPYVSPLILPGTKWPKPGFYPNG